MHTNRTILIGKDKGKKQLRARCRGEKKIFLFGYLTAASRTFTVDRVLI
jgi:hypothetical protein